MKKLCPASGYCPEETDGVKCKIDCRLCGYYRSHLADQAQLNVVHVSMLERGVTEGYPFVGNRGPKSKR